ncbi:NADH dehydrogenase [ubiquinone] iron-sulfur protein 5-like [Pongo abelii]|uniref:NADH dehydrogenase [ubiquinone] iron-sulfur protein 5-like n=1 Tax=Pongo abelii TaxID=9601 RepID=UPI0023E77A7B|nr:NADH dehydrogenase [ubiquinone] iron-sulfur protein 5-like [Pongo abelii]
MPFLDVQKRFGLNVDRWLTIQSAEQPYKILARCHPFEKEWIECAHGIGGIWAEKECKIEYDYFIECMLWQKTMRRVITIRKQWNKLIKEGKYTPPPQHMRKGEPWPLSRVPQCWDYRYEPLHPAVIKYFSALFPSLKNWDRSTDDYTLADICPLEEALLSVN